jgi:hypothetical protein
MYTHFIIILSRVYKDQNEHYAIPTSNGLGLAPLEDFKNNTHILINLLALS